MDNEERFNWEIYSDPGLASPKSVLIDYATELRQEMEEEIKIALLNAIWISRWNEDQTALTSVLTVEEAEKICKNIVIELDEAKYKIVKKKNLTKFSQNSKS